MLSASTPSAEASSSATSRMRSRERPDGCACDLRAIELCIIRCTQTEGDLGGRPIDSQGPRVGRVRGTGALLRLVDRRGSARAALLAHRQLCERAGGARCRASVDRDGRDRGIRPLLHLPRGGVVRGTAAAACAGGGGVRTRRARGDLRGDLPPRVRPHGQPPVQGVAGRRRPLVAALRALVGELRERRVPRAHAVRARACPVAGHHGSGAAHVRRDRRRDRRSHGARRRATRRGGPHPARWAHGGPDLGPARGRVGPVGHARGAAHERADPDAPPRVPRPQLERLWRARSAPLPPRPPLRSARRGPARVRVDLGQRVADRRRGVLWRRALRTAAHVLRVRLGRPRPAHRQRPDRRRRRVARARGLPPLGVADGVADRADPADRPLRRSLVLRAGRDVRECDRHPLARGPAADRPHHVPDAVLGYRGGWRARALGARHRMSGRTRREVLRDGAALGAAAALSAYGVAPAAPRRRRRVAVLGGGVGGLTVAHELAERGFEVTVYERRAFGGKARSFGVPGTALGGRRPLPGEHGARFIPGLYVNLPDTLRRIPLGRGRSTYDNVVVANQDMYARSGGRPEWTISFTPTDTRGWTFEQFRDTLITSLEVGTHLPPHEIAFFVDRVLLYMASCDARRFGQWERMSWWDYVAADRFSEDYRRLLVSSVTRFLLSAKATEASARTLGLLWEQSVYTYMGRTYGAYDRVLNLPTNEAWIDPWLAQLRKLGVKLRLGAELKHLEMRGSRIASARIGNERVEADWYVLAVPVERAPRLLGAPILRADPRLEGVRKLETRWQNGIQFFTREPLPLAHGHVLYIDSPWALTSISQAQFWESRSFTRDYGDGSVRDCVSVDIGDFGEPGILYGKPARALRPAQIARETWAQMKAHLNDSGHRLLRDDQMVRWVLDPGLVWRRGRSGPVNEDQLRISTPRTWNDRPGAATAIPNLMLAADYVKVGIDTATMEGANEAGRRAANAILDRSGSPRSPARVS